MRKLLLTLLLVLMSASVSYAKLVDLKASNITLQSQLKFLTKEVGYAIGIPSLTPSDPMGLLGFDIGAEVSGFKFEDAEPLFGDTGLVMKRLHIQKGLPWKFDIGVEFAEAVETNIESVGGELRWALTEDGAVMPAIGVRGTYSEMKGVTDVELTTTTFGAQVSKEILFITPFVGATHFSSEGKVKNSGLKTEKETNSSVYAGVNLSAWIIQLAFQTDFSDNDMYSLKLSISSPF